jgi:hypothetical protein
MTKRACALTLLACLALPLAVAAQEPAEILLVEVKAAAVSPRAP